MGRARRAIEVAFAGIDRYFERYYRKGPRRRPVRVEFCEADVLDAFDGWRRAVGVAAPIAIGKASSVSSGDGDSSPTRRRASLAAHVERAIARLTTLRASAGGAQELSEVLESTSHALDALQADARRARGEAREALMGRLVSLMTPCSRRHRALDEPGREAATPRSESLAPFRDRMAPEAFQRAC